MPRLELFTLGSVRLVLDGSPVVIPRHKALAVFVYLCLTKKVHKREKLATLYWPEASQASALAYLRQALWELNKNLGEGWLLADPDTVSLHPEADLWLDVDEFRALLASVRGHGHPASAFCKACIPPLTQAISLYQGDFLAGIVLRDSPEFDDWQFFEAEALRQEYADALSRLVAAHETKGEFQPALEYARRWVSLDPIDEKAQRVLMQLYERTGQRNAALRQYHECVRILKEELHIAPEAATTGLYYQIQKGSHPEARAVAPAWVEAPVIQTRRVSLPIPSTPFIGRRKELDEISVLLQNPECRLLTLLGPGGIGKTRLAIQIAQELQDSYPQGVIFIPLARLRSVEEVIPAILASCGIVVRPEVYGEKEGHGLPKEQLLNYLRAKNMLLVLDNFEHLIEAVDLLQEMTASAPQVKLLVTSRQRLSLQREYALEVRGMRYPGVEITDPAEIEKYSAVKLFLQSASRTRVGFRLSPDDYPALLQIMHLVAGLPLALELAAGWVNILTLKEIAAEIERDLDFLETDLRDIPERQRGLRVVFEQSWRLLSEREQQLYAQLSIFYGSFSRPAAQGVTGISLRELLSLVGKSLLQRSEGERFEMHSLLHYYASQKLLAQPDLHSRTSDRHSEYYCALLAEFEIALKGSGEQEAMNEISAALPNLKAAFEWAYTHSLAARQAKALEGLALFYFHQERNDEGKALFQRAASAMVLDPVKEEKLLLARLLAWQSYFTTGDNPEALRLSQASLALLDSPEFEPQQVVYHRALSLLFYSSFQAYMGRLNTAKEGSLQSLELLGGTGERYWTSDAFMCLGSISVLQNDPDLARHFFEKCLSIRREMGSPIALADSLYNIGSTIGFYTGDILQGGQYLQECAAIYQTHPDLHSQVHMLASVDSSFSMHGKFTESTVIREKRIVIWQELGNTLRLGGEKAGLCENYLHLGDYSKAEEIGREALALLSGTGHSWPRGFIAWWLGVAYLMLQKYPEARASFQLTEAISLTQVTYYSGMADLGLSMLEIRLGNIPQAWQHIHKALSLVVDQMLLYLNYGLSVMALLLAGRGEVEKAIELYTLVRRYPNVANSCWFADFFGKPIQSAIASLPAEVAAAAQQRGQLLDARETVRRLIVGFDTQK